MKVDLTKLLTNQVSSLNIDESVNIPEEYLEDSLIDKLENVRLVAKFSLDEEDNILLNGDINGIMWLKDDITLEPIAYKFSTKIEEIINNMQNILDITEILWQNILVEIPSKVRKTDEDVYLSGDGWRVISEDRYNEEMNKANNPFQNLDELLKTKEDK